MSLEELNVVQITNIQVRFMRIKIHCLLYKAKGILYSQVDREEKCVTVNYTPTIPHCSMATLIGLSIKVPTCLNFPINKILTNKLLINYFIYIYQVCLIRSLPSNFKVEVSITPGSHASEAAVNKQLADKERVSAALENNNLIEVVNQCLVKSLH